MGTRRQGAAGRKPGTRSSSDSAFNCVSFFDEPAAEVQEAALWDGFPDGNTLELRLWPDDQTFSHSRLKFSRLLLPDFSR